jgi:hypothetical protein
MGESLTPNERAALRRLEEEVSRDDPELAGRLERLDPAPARRPLWVRCSVRCWLFLGCALVAVGGSLGVESAVAVGLLLVGAGVLRSRPGRRAARATWVALVEWWRAQA